MSEAGEIPSSERDPLREVLEARGADREALNLSPEERFEKYADQVFGRQVIVTSEDEQQKVETANVVDVDKEKGTITVNYTRWKPEGKRTELTADRWYPLPEGVEEEEEEEEPEEE